MDYFIISVIKFCPAFQAQLMDLLMRGGSLMLLKAILLKLLLSENINTYNAILIFLR